MWQLGVNVARVKVNERLGKVMLGERKRAVDSRNLAMCLLAMPSADAGGSISRFLMMVGRNGCSRQLTL